MKTELHIAALEQRVVDLETRILALEAQLDAVRGTVFRVAGLTPKENSVLSVLYRRPGPVTKDQIHSLLYGMEIDGGAEPKIIDVFVCKMRKKLSPMGVEIETAWGVGYELPEKSRQILASFIERRAA